MLLEANRRDMKYIIRFSLIAVVVIAILFVASPSRAAIVPPAPRIPYGAKYIDSCKSINKKAVVVSLKKGRLNHNGYYTPKLCVLKKKTRNVVVGVMIDGPKSNGWPYFMNDVYVDFPTKSRITKPRYTPFLSAKNVRLDKWVTFVGDYVAGKKNAKVYVHTTAYTPFKTYNVYQTKRLK